LGIQDVFYSADTNREVTFVTVRKGEINVYEQKQSPACPITVGYEYIDLNTSYNFPFFPRLKKGQPIERGHCPCCTVGIMFRIRESGPKKYCRTGKNNISAD
jgi:hypothetical protein